MDKHADKLDGIFSMQARLDGFIAEARALEFSKEEWLQKKSLALISEVAELLNEVNFKWWKNPKELNDANIKEELADILHFFISMCLSAGLTSGELFDIYIKKNDENRKRQTGESEKTGYKI
jgi:dimeric dUTPase (all-alpha-NTP-PPase superfamily)